MPGNAESPIIFDGMHAVLASLGCHERTHSQILPYFLTTNDQFNSFLL
jgi:hypothetical protein